MSVKQLDANPAQRRLMVFHFLALTSVVVFPTAGKPAEQPKRTIAVFDPKAIGEVKSGQVGVLMERILVQIERIGRYETVTRDDINALLNQEQLKCT